MRLSGEYSLAGSAALLLLVLAATCGVEAAKEAAPPPLPSIETVLAQDFEVSVITSSHGTFNATLRVKGSMNFPDRVHGELVPHGTPVLQEGQTPLPCFSRERDFTDDKYAPAVPLAVADSASSKDKKAAKARAAALAAKGVERPTLLAFDIKLHHANSPRGTVSVYVLPADSEAMIEAREAIQDGSATPTATATFVFRPERAAIAGSPIGNVPALARIASSALSLSSSSEEEEEGQAAAANAEGDFTLRLFSEHEFTLELHVPSGKEVGAARERVWVHGYTEPNANVFARRDNERPWWHIPAMLAIGSLTSVVQVLTGLKDGQKKAAERKALEGAVADQEKEKQQIKEKKDK